MLRFLAACICLAVFSQSISLADEQAIQERIKAYVKAFNSGDAEAIAKLHTLEATWLTPSGDEIKGRQEMQKQFAAFFLSAKNAKLELSETSIEMLSPHVGIERGIARVLVPGEEPTTTNYQVVHVKTDDDWKIDRIQEQEPPPAPLTHYQQLKSLEWMIGNWSHDSEATSIHISCRWTTNQNFILRTFQVKGLVGGDIEGSQVIGWDPSSNTVRSWTFDSDGGFGVGRWKQTESRWTVQTLQTLADGRQASSTNIYDLLDENTVRYSSVGVQVDGELIPSFGPVLVSRITE